MKKTRIPKPTDMSRVMAEYCKNMKKAKVPKPMDIVRFAPAKYLKEWLKKHPLSYPIKEGDQLLYLGEIRQMSGHCAVVSRDGRILWAYHIPDFEVISEEEA